MPLSLTQKGAIGQFAFLVTALATGKGQVEIYSPSADNEGRDAEVRRHLKPAPAISIQIKVAFSRVISDGRRYLWLRFAILENRIQNDPRLWYFFAFFDGGELRLHDPVFLIPSHVLHKMGRRGRQGKRIWFEVLASLEPASHDRWSPYRVARADLGKRLLEIIDQAPLTAGSRALKLPSDSVLIGRARRRVARPRVGRAARAA
jgi:hypothetical protein